MAEFIFTYRTAKGYVPNIDSEAMAAWSSWFESFADRIVDHGRPVLERAAVGEVGATTQLGGYSIVRADDLDAAVALAKGCPALQGGGGVEVGVLMDMSAQTPAPGLQEQTSRA